MLIRTTLCYIENNNDFLMLHRTKKKNDSNEGKWIGVGGHIEENESVIECLKREVYEETNLLLNSYIPRGIIFFNSEIYDDEIMFLFTSNDFSGEITNNCHEGELKWISKNEIFNLNLWEGDKYFLNELINSNRFFFMHLYYDKDNNLVNITIGGENFTEKVYEAVANIPKGKVSTYGDIAAICGHIGASRAVGNILHKNPFDEIIPCHRVVNSKGRLATNFGFGEGIQKERLLKENVEIVDNIVKKEYFW